MSQSRERRRAKRAEQFGGHTPEASYRPEQKPATASTQRGQEYDSARDEKAVTPEGAATETAKRRPEDARGETPGRE